MTGLIAFMTLGMAALRIDDEVLATAVLGLAVPVLGTTTLAAFYQREAWAGFAVFGRALLFICQPHNAPPVEMTPLPMELAYRACLYAHSPVKSPWVSFRTLGYPTVFADCEGYLMVAAVTGTTSGFRGMVPVNSVLAGLCLATILAGVVGAFIGGLVGRRCGPGHNHGDGGPSSVTSP